MSCSAFKVRSLFLFSCLLLLLPGCAIEHWKRSTLSRKPGYPIHKPQELWEKTGSQAFGTNGLFYLEPAANLVDYAFDSRNRASEISLSVNRDHTITIAGRQAGAGQQIRLQNFKRLSRTIRLKDSTGWFRLAASVAIPPGRPLEEEHALTLLLGILLQEPQPHRPTQSAKRELSADLQALAVYDYANDLILVEWTKQAEPAPRSVQEQPPPDIQP